MAKERMTFKDLAVWQRRFVLCVKVYQATRSFPKEELYGSTSQMRRAASSVPSNVAAGSARWGSAEFRHFVSVALGSLAELETFVELSRALGYLESAQAEELSEGIAETQRLLVALHRSLKCPSVK